ncbi:MAG TPA: oligosaccharide flippase family protein [Clostridiales bacterium]|nr:oligosaccharide flippase family protein [Clostridiales bacterium]HQP69984.1 oligosaccharide flippase family protein [Clostridiales bacterium]
MFRSNLINLIISYTGLFLGLFNTFFKPKVMTSEEIGILSTILSITALLQLLSYAGLQSVIMRFYPVFKETENKAKFISSVVITSYFLLCFVLFLLFLCKSIIISYYGSGPIEEYFIYIPGYLILSHSTELFERISRVLFVSVKSNMIRNIHFKTANCIYLILMFIFSLSFQSYIRFFMIMSLVTLIQMIWLSIKNLKIKWAYKDLIPDLKFMRQFISYSFFMLVASISGNLANNLDKIMIGHYLNLSKTGIYAIALAITSMMNIIFESFSRITQPKLSEYVQTQNIPNIRKTFYDNLYNNIHFGVIVFVLISVFSRDILSLLGKEYTEGTTVIIIIAIGQLSNLSTGMCGEIVSLSKYYRFDFYSRTILIFIVIASNAVFIPIFGITGAAVATSSNLIIYDIFKMIYAYRKFGIHPFTRTTLNFYISGLIIAFVISILKHFMYINLINISLISLFSFILYDIILGYVFNYEYSIIRKLKKKYIK